MASRFIIAVALFAVCHSSPVTFGDAVREQRSYKEADALSSNYGGKNQVSASISGQNVQAQGSNDDQGHYAHDGIATANRGETKVRVIESDNTPLGVARFQPAYYSAPASVVTYDQNYDVLNQGAYKAQSFAGNGQAAANAQAQTDPTNIAAKTQGYNSVYTPSYDLASSIANANSQSGYAASSAKTGQVPARKSISWRFGTAYDHPAAYIRSAPSNQDFANTLAQAAQGSSAESIADTNRGIVTAATKSNGGQGVANANINNQGLDIVRSGETYYGDIIRSAPSNQGSANTYAQAVENSSAQSIADTNHGIVTAATKSNGGQGVANANINNQGLDIVRSGETYYGDIIRSGPSNQGSANTHAQAMQDSSAQSIADTNRGIVTAETTSNGGQGVAAANIRNQGFGIVRSGETYYNRPADITSNAYSVGDGSARAAADYERAVSTAYSNGVGSSSSNSQIRSYVGAPSYY